MVEQVGKAIRTAMKGQDPSSVSRAVRQGQMHADFLVVLAIGTNMAIFEDGERLSLKIALVYQTLRIAALSVDESNWMPAWAAAFRALALDIFSLQEACDLIREKYFDGERILLEDAKEEIEKLANATRQLMVAFDGAVSKFDHQLAVNCEMFRGVVSARTSTRAEYIAAIAKSKMLEGSGDQEAADAVLRPYLLESLNENGTEHLTT